MYIYILCVYTIYVHAFLSVYIYIRARNTHTAVLEIKVLSIARCLLHFSFMFFGSLLMSTVLFNIFELFTFHKNNLIQSSEFNSQCQTCC